MERASFEDLELPAGLVGSEDETFYRLMFGSLMEAIVANGGLAKPCALVTAMAKYRSNVELFKFAWPKPKRLAIKTVEGSFLP